MEQSKYTAKQRFNFVNKVLECSIGIHSLLKLAVQEYLKEEDTKEQRGTSITPLEVIIKEKEDNKIRTFINTLSPDEKIMAIVLYYGGRAVETGEIDLPDDYASQQIIFIDFCIDLMEYYRLSFGKMPDSKRVDISGKHARLMAEFIKLSISVLGVNIYHSFD